MSYILIGGDVAPTKSNIISFENGFVERFIDKRLLQIFDASAYNIINLETPLTNTETPIHKSGPALISSTRCINGLKKMNINLCGIANNHILDQGEIGLKSTISVLRDNNINTVGAGEDIETAAQSYVFDFEGLAIGVLAFAEHEFSIVTKDRGGANAADLYNMCTSVQQLRDKSDYIIVLYHGGKEFYRYPSPQLQEKCRILIDSGANLILCQHSHCIGCEEKYHDGRILYGQGNYIFDGGDDEFWNSGIIVRISDKLEVDYIYIEKENGVIKLSETEKLEKINNEFNLRSENIKNRAFLCEKYSEYAEQFMWNYFYEFSGKESFAFKLLNKIMKNKLRLFKYSHMYSTSNLLAMLNFVSCEAHSEMLQAGLEKMIYRRVE